MDDYQQSEEDPESTDDIDSESVLRCAQCGTAISKPEYLFQRDELGIYANPHGHVFDLITVSYAENVQSHGESTTEFTWFAGYAWRVLGCAHCNLHLGWRFEATQSGQTPSVFFGLLRNHLN